MIGVQGGRDGPLQAGRLRRADPPPADVLRGARGVRLNDGRRSRLRQRRAGELRGRGTVVLAVACALAPAGCHRDTTVGAPIRSSVAPVPPREAPPPRRSSQAGLPVVAKVRLDDPHAEPLHQQVRGRVRRGGPAHRLSGQAARARAHRRRHRYPDGSARRPAQPTVLHRGRPARGRTRPARGIALKGRSAARTSTPTCLGRRLTPTPTTIARCRRRSPDRSARWPLRASRRRDAPTRRGRWSTAYARALEVIAREWRVGEGPPGRCRPTPAPAAQRELFAAVRENRYIARRRRRAARRRAELLADPGVAATVLYRLAQSKTVGPQGRARRASTRRS